MTANNDQETPADLVMFLETVGSADLTSEEIVRGLLRQISPEALKRDLGFEMSIDQLVPFCMVNHLNNSFTVSQARNFFFFFGKGELSVEKIAAHLKNTSVANVFAQKKAAVKKLQKFAHAEVGTEKIVSISKLLRNSALVQKLRALSIHETEDLIKLTSAKFVEKLSKGGTFKYLSIQNIAKKLDAIGQHFADGSEATQRLFKYQPETYRPLLETQEPDSAAPPGGAADEPGSAVPAASLIAETSTDTLNQREEVEEILTNLIKENVAKLGGSFEKSETYLCLKPKINGKKHRVVFFLDIQAI